MKRTILRFALTALFCALSFSQYVYWEPEVPVPGGDLTIYYNTIDGALPYNTMPVYIHLGYNGWQETDDYAMTYAPELGSGWFEYTYSVPANAQTIDFVFTDLDGNWDNNGGVGIDWHISMNYYWTPFNPGADDDVVITLNNAPMNGEVAWTVDAGGGHVIPIEDYWPADSYEDEGWLMTPITSLGGDVYELNLGQFSLGSQVVESIKFRIRWDDGEWDVGDNGQIINYDIYFDYSYQSGDPYVFFISPQEGADVSGSVTLGTVGSAEYVEYWVYGEMIGTDDSSPYEVVWTPDPELFGDVTILAKAVGTDGRITFLFRTVNILFTINHAPVPGNADDGLNIDGNNIIITLYAPEKDFVTVKGSWNIENQLGELMSLSGDTLWWYQTTLPDGDYTYQFNVQDERIMADPWSKDVIWVDPGGGWESGDYTHAKTNFTIGAEPYQWNDQDFTRPEQRDVIVYEMHVGDFLGIDGQIGRYTDVTAKIEEGYFDDLGVNAIELMPVNEFEGENSWGYNPTFYMAPESTYGTPDELRELVDTAHQHGIAVLMDVVFNHMWGSAPLFLLYQPVDNWDYEDHNYNYCPYFHNQESEWGYKLQHWSPRTRKHIDDVLMTWVEDYHMDGFRFDHTQGIGWDSNNQWGASHYGNMLHSYDPSIIIIAEEDNSWQINNTDFDAGWDYSFFHMMKANLQETSDGGHSWGDMYDLGNHIVASSQGYNSYTGPLNYCESHDETRIIYEATVYQGISLQDAYKKSKLGASVLLTSQGTPMLYHGQEFGQNGTSHSGGNIQPQPLQWENLETDDGADLFDATRKLIALRQHYEVLRSWDLDLRYQSSVNKSIVYWRTNGSEEVVVAANFHNTDRTFDIEFPHGGTWYDFLTEEPVTIESNWYGSYTIPASTARIFLTEIPDFEEDILIGDVNFDLAVDVLDIVVLVDMILNNYPDPGTDLFTASDVNGDGSIDVLDIVQLIDIILGN